MARDTNEPLEQIRTQKDIEDYLTDAAWRGEWNVAPGMSPSELIRQLAVVLVPVVAAHVKVRERMAARLRERVSVEPEMVMRP